MPICLCLQLFQEELTFEHLSYWNRGCFKEEIICHYMFAIYIVQNQVYTDSKAFCIEYFLDICVPHISLTR